MDTCSQPSYGASENCINATTANHAMERSLATEGSTEEPELLGSVTHNQESDGTSTGLQIRSSARVSKKMRLDSIAPPIVPEKKAPVISEKKAPAIPEKKEPVKEEEKPESKQAEVKPKRRPCELWSLEDKNTFFEALNEYGKDFDLIQNYFATKARRKGLSEHMSKNKYQVQHFYYRTWHKISKHLKFSEDVKKATQELYSLINYGELRKKIGAGVSEKICMKLNDLIHRGSTQIRIRGKTLRIKTPLCRALRKLNQLEECQEELKLPARVSIELRPRSTEAWCRVQATSQNPRVQTVLPLQRRLTSLLTFLQQRWRMPHIKHRDRLLNSVSCAELGHDPEEHRKEKENLLHVAPRPDVEISLPTLNITEYVTSSSISLSAYGERMANWTDLPASLKGGSKGCASKKGSKKQKNESASEKKAQEVAAKHKENVHQQDESANCATSVDLLSINNNACDSDDKTMIMLLKNTGFDGVENTKVKPAATSDINAMAVNHILFLQHQTDMELQDPLKVEMDMLPSTSDQPQQPQLQQQRFQQHQQQQRFQQDQQQQIFQQNQQKQRFQQQQEAKAKAAEETITRIRRGWSLLDAHHVTIGEMYLMFGLDSKLQLDYWWEELKPAPYFPPPLLPPPPPILQQTKVNSPPLVPASEGVSVIPPVATSVPVSPPLPKDVSLLPPAGESTQITPPEGEEALTLNPVATVLQKLVSIAKLNYRKSKLVCPCGHICGVPIKISTSSKKPIRVTRPIAESPDKIGPGTSSREGPRFIPAPKNRPLLLSKALPLHDGVFRRPLLAPSMYKTLPKVGAAEAFKAQLDKFRPRYCNRRGRSVRPKSVVVQRMLPLLPKAPNGHAMVTLKVVPQTSQLSGEFMPIGTPTSSVLSFGPPRPGPSKRPEVLPVPSRLLAKVPTVTVLPTQQPASRSLGIVSNATPQQSNVPAILPKEPSPPHSPTSRMSSPPSISNLLDLELHSAVGDDISLADVCSNGLLDVSLPAPSFVGLLPNEGRLQPAATPPTSPSRILKEDNQWLNSEVADFSLSSFLGHLESPLKSAPMVPSTPVGDDTRLSSDVEAQLQCLMSENSVDYMAKFADLAAQIASESANKK